MLGHNRLTLPGFDGIIAVKTAAALEAVLNVRAILF